jgi:hypothetical protein
MWFSGLFMTDSGSSSSGRPLADGMSVPAENADVEINPKVRLRSAEVLRTLHLRISTLDDLVLAHSPYPTTDADAGALGPDTYRFLQADQ